MPIVIIDPGHGGSDPGAVGAGGTQEKEVNLAVSLQVADILSQVAEVRLTRTEDRVPGDGNKNEFFVRAQTANQCGADCFVSIHCNSAATPAAHGTETFCYTGSSRGRQMAVAIQKRLVEALGLADRKIKEANFAVLRLTTCPSALVELAFISNAAEEGCLKSPIFQAKAARAIAGGIADFLGLEIRDGQTVKINVMGQVLEGVLIQDRTYVPVRALAEALGRTVEWDEKNKTVYIA